MARFLHENTLENDPDTDLSTEQLSGLTDPYEFIESWIDCPSRGVGSTDTILFHGIARHSLHQPMYNIRLTVRKPLTETSTA